MATIDKIAKQVGKAMKSAGMTKTATLTVVTPGIRAPGAASAGTNPTTVDYDARGFVEDWTKDRVGETVVVKGDRVITLFGALIAGGVVPAVDNRITIEGVTSTIIDVQRDPAAATYVCLTR